VKLGWKVLDALASASVVGSFGKSGYAIRRHLFTDPDLDVDLSGRTMVITGASTGLGKSAAQSLAQRGASLVLVARDAARLERAREDVRACARYPQRVTSERADLSELAEVRRLAQRLVASHPQIHVLVHNAGVLPLERQLTSEGLDAAFATNVLAGFLLTHELTGALGAAAGGRVVHVTSGGMYLKRLELEELEGRRAPYDGVAVYAQVEARAGHLERAVGRAARASGHHLEHGAPGLGRDPGRGAIAAALPRAPARRAAIRRARRRHDHLARGVARGRRGQREAVLRSGRARDPRRPVDALERCGARRALGSVLRADGRLAVKGALRRRLVTVPRMLLLAVVLWGTAPLMFPLAFLIDVVRFALARTPFTTTRLLAFGLVYTACETIGMLVLLCAPLVTGRDPERRLDATYRIQAAWAAALLRAAEILFGLRVSVDGAEALDGGPLLLFMRHASIVDTLLPTVVLARPKALRLRFVLKRELLALPCLDIAGHRIPNCFVARGGEDSEREIERVRELGRGLGPRDAVIIYPEGTRFTHKKLSRALLKLEQSAPERFARVSALRHILPVRPGGPLALLDGHTPCDVVFVAHAGLETFAELVDVWRGRMVGARVRVSLRRVPRAEIERAGPDRLGWLDAEWSKLDAWVHEHEGR
jgi:NAD(P)-dependent dehydrogenase (short-subunit alcohol dehydrogenase family)/1-acyl-sn-glycerol-3-phosphate acyltransferase